MRKLILGLIIDKIKFMNLNTKDKKFIYVIIILDIIIISLHLIFAKNYNFFNIGKEENLPTYYMGIKLFLVAGLIFYYSQKTKWYLSSIYIFLMFIYAGFDEILEIHENAAKEFYHIIEKFFYSQDRFSWLFLFAPILLISLIITIKFINRLGKNKKWFYIGLLILSMAIGLEVVESLYYESSYIYISIFFEESFEIIAITFFIYAIYTSILNTKNTKNIVRIN